MKPLLPFNENERLRILGQYNILDTPPEDRFDEIVRCAARQFKTPIALFTLIDANRQWCKSRIGSDNRETDRAISFCAHVVAINGPLVIEDTSTNEEFANNPLVVGHPRIAFYAGVPVRALTGEPLGALCISDTSPRRFPWQDFLLLKEMAAQIEVQLEARQAEAHRPSNGTMH